MEMHVNTMLRLLCRTLGRAIGGSTPNVIDKNIMDITLSCIGRHSMRGFVWTQHKAVDERESSSLHLYLNL